MDPRMAHSYASGALPAVPLDSRHRGLSRIAEEVPRGVDAALLPTFYPAQQPQAQQQATTARDNREAEALTEESSPSHPSKRQRILHTCEVCNTNYTEKRALARHKHTDQHRLRIGLDPLKKYECSVCGTQFSRRHDRMRHENERHGGPKSTSPGAKSSRRQSSPPSAPDAGLAPLGRRTPPSETEDNSGSVATSETLDDDSFLNMEYLLNPASYHGSSTPESIGSQFSLNNHYGSTPFTPQSMESSMMLAAIFEDQMCDPNQMAALNFPLPDNTMTEELTSDGEVSRHDSAFDEGGSRKASEVSQASSDYSNIDVVAAPAAAPPRRRSFELPSLGSSHRKKSLMSRRGKLREIGTAAGLPMLCVICGSPFEDQEDDLLSHLRKHMDDLKSAHYCEDCQIAFVREEDLQRHRTSAATGNCGFNFHHTSPCTGHHPPLADDPWAGLSDRDSFRLSVKLGHWEQSQLQAYISQINELASAQKGRSKNDPRRGSMSSFEYLAPSRPVSLYSSAGVSVRTYDTAPVDVNSNGDSDVGGLARRLRNISFARSKTVADAVTGNSSSQREPSRRASAATAQLSKTLRKAIYRCSLDRVERLLLMGADPTLLQTDDSMLTIMALWDRASAQALIVQHTIGQQCYGARCGCALSRPTESRDPELIRALLDHGANANDAGGLCGFPLHTAAYMGKPDVVRILLEYGASVHARAKNKYGSALACAAARADQPGNVDVARLLVEAGADPSAHAGPEGSAIAIASRLRERCAVGVIGPDALRPEAHARINCCEEVLRIMGAE